MAEHPQVAVAAHHYHVMDGGGETEVDIVPLGHVSQAAGPPLDAVQCNSAPRNGQYADDSVEQGAFAGAVGADHAHQVAWANVEIHIVEGAVPVPLHG